MQDLQKILNEREESYGSFEKNGQVSQRLKAILRDDNITEPAQQEALDLIATKLSRILCGDPYHVDSWRDIAGYCEQVALIVEKRNKEAQAPLMHTYKFNAFGEPNK